MDNVEKIVRIVHHIRDVVPACEVFAGLGRSQIETRLSEVGVERSPELCELYGLIGEIYNLGSGLNFLSLEVASRLYQLYRDLSSDNFTWWPSLFPLLDMDGVLQVCVDLENSELYLIDVENGTARLICRDYQVLLDALLEAVESGIFSMEPISGSLVLEKSAWTIIKIKYGVQ
jgi:hypothetical protein